MDKTTGRFAAGKRGEKVLWKYIVSLVILIVYLLPIYVLVVMSLKERTDFSSRQWQITFDWFVRPNNFPKVLDGNYDDKKSGYDNQGPVNSDVPWQ